MWLQLYDSCCVSKFIVKLAIIYLFDNSRLGLVEYVVFTEFIIIIGKLVLA